MVGRKIKHVFDFYIIVRTQLKREIERYGGGLAANSLNRFT
jgi:hypothetical protein